jgi:hypothetical protein
VVVVVDDEPFVEGSFLEGSFEDDSLVDEPFFDDSLFAASADVDVDRLSLR